MYTSFERSIQRQVSIHRKFLDLIKKKFKDDLMENLLQEEYQTVKSSKTFKKKKKRNFNSNNQQSAQAATLSNTPSTVAGDKGPGPSLSAENIVAAVNEALSDEPTKLKAKKKKGNIGGKPTNDKVSSNMSSIEQP